MQSRFLWLWVVLALTACAAPATPQPRAVHLTLAGADSMQWMARALVSAYVPDHPLVTISVQPTNSAVGIVAAHAYSNTIGMVSRTIKPSELVGTRAVVVARDGVAVIVNQKNPINAIQRAQVAQVFAGEILTWPTGPDVGKPIMVVSREQGSGTRDAFETMVMAGRRVTLTAVVMPGEAAVVDYIAQHSDAIGYVSMAALNAQVHTLVLDDVALSPLTVETQKYPLVRSLSFVIPLEPPAELQDFVNFVLGPDGQAIISQQYGRAP